MKSERQLLRENLERFRTKNPHRTEDPAERQPKFQKLNEEEIEEANQQKNAFINREKRVAEGNWKGSIGKFVETHGAEIGQAVDNKQLGKYVKETMIPALGDEAKKYLENLLATCKTPSKLLFALYNINLKGSGLGLHEDKEPEGKHHTEDPQGKGAKFQRLTESVEDSCQQARDYCIEKGLHIKPVSWLEKYMDFPEYYEEQYPDEGESDLRDRMWTDATETGAAIALQEIEAILRAEKEDEYDLYDMIDTDYGFSIVDDPNLSPEDFNY